MPPLPNVNAVKVVLSHSVTGTTREWVNILHLDYGASPPDQSQIDALATAFDADYDIAFTDFCHVSDVHESSKYEDLSSDTGVIAFTNPTSPGGSTGTLAPLNICAVGSWQIQRRYRGGKPRSYLSALTEAQAPGPNKLDTTFQTNWSNALGTFLTAWTNKTVSGITYSLACVSYRNGNAARVTPLVEDVIGVIVQPFIRTQRRRLGTSS
jgi:hypothetical protein